MDVQQNSASLATTGAPKSGYIAFILIIQARQEWQLYKPGGHKLEFTVCPEGLPVTWPENL